MSNNIGKADGFKDEEYIIIPTESFADYAEHPLVRLAAECPDQLILCPHQGGISHAAFREAARMVFADLEKLMDGKRPERVVNGL